MADVCVTQQCGLCCFKLYNGEDIIAFGSDGRLSTPFQNGPAFVVNESDAYIQCVGACLHSGGQAVGCHAECVNQVPARRLSAVLKVWTYNYEPARSETNRRITWLHQTFSSLLRSDVFGKKMPTLPPELLSQITAYCYSSFAIEYTMARLALGCTKANARTTVISMSQRIWAHFTTFEGVDYIAPLNNAADHLHAEIIFEPDPVRSVKTVYIAEIATVPCVVLGRTAS
ncbi:hypothetical protein CDEST_01686 [Colletotrichum destructivum]|uniref:Uncharacterized protein n=1 Tax=Colletotrichum destructivum TaxID=34406 RepID=A0AAX4I017_9PEZI|nr:hypothetical protein CDEST_01686 [Colletotrichum destructivum]